MNKPKSLPFLAYMFPKREQQHRNYTFLSLTLTTIDK